MDGNIGFLQNSKGESSLIRLCGFVAIIGIFLLVLDVIATPILIVFFAKEYISYIPGIVAAIAAVIGTLATVILYKAIQSFSENKTGV